jgi:aspartyl-tRNA(Asn)/glutamyl-tRNA(Gln) amidotransferase subunit C
MKRADIEHLALLARIKLSEAEKERLPAQLSSIVEYVSVVSDIAGDSAQSEPEVGARYNIFRADVPTNQPDQYTKDILAEMPSTKGRFMAVKKILQQD